MDSAVVRTQSSKSYDESSGVVKSSGVVNSGTGNSDVVKSSGTVNSGVVISTRPNDTNKNNNTPKDSLSSRTYLSDLVQNLDMPPVSNPSYLCQQRFSQCDHLKNTQSKQQCESFWTTLCTNSNIPSK